MKNLKGKVSIIIPAYNESQHIVKNIIEVSNTLNDFGCQYEIIIVDDGSLDDTFQEAMRIMAKHKDIIVKRNRSNYGKGRALKKGFRYASGDYVVFLDADMDLHPAQIQTFFDIMRLDNADVVIGSKRHPNSQVDYPWHRRIVSGVYFFLVKLMFDLPVNDTQTGLKIFKTEVLKKVFPRVLIKRFAFDLEILANARHLGYKIVQAPVIVNFQRHIGRISIIDIYNTWWDTMAIFYRMYILRYYDKKQ